MVELKVFLKRLYGYIDIPQQLVVILFMFISTIFGMSIPQIIRIIVDDVIGNRKFELITTIGVILIIVTVFQGVAEFFQNFFVSRIGELTARKLRDQIYEKISKLDYINRNTYRAGNMISLFNNDVNQVYGLIASFAAGFVAQAILFVVLLVTLLAINVKLTIFSILTVPLYFIFFSFLGWRMRGLANNRQQIYVKLNTILQEDIFGMNTIQNLRATESKKKKFLVVLNNMLKNNVQFAAVNSSLSQVASLVAGFGNVVVLWVGSRMVMHNETSLGQLIAFSSYLGRMYAPILSLVSINQMFQSALPSLKRIFSFLDQTNYITDDKDSVCFDEEFEKIELSNVSVQYANGKKALNNINITIKKGQYIAIVGESGCGKTTITNLLTKMIEPISGNIMINGNDYKKYTIDSLRKIIGIAPQDPVIFTDTVEENITVGLDSIETERVNNVIERAAASFIYSLPQGIKTEIGERGYNLSGGERQRIALARILLRDYKLLLLDEPTSSIDNLTRKELMEGILKERKDKAIVVITHRLDDVKDADVIYVIRDGYIVGSGTHIKLLNECEYYKKLYEAQIENEVSLK